MVIVIKEDLLFIFQKLLEKRKITIDEYNKAVRLILHVYHKELKCGDVVKIYSKRENNAVYVVGERDGETSFTVKFTLAN